LRHRSAEHPATHVKHAQAACGQQPAFSDKQIELVDAFADQAVIAIENVRLFDKAQARTRELSGLVQELPALGEVGRAVSSMLDVKTVLKTIVDRAVDLSSSDAGSIFQYHKETGTFELGETTGLDEEIVARFGKLDISANEAGPGEAITKRQRCRIRTPPRVRATSCATPSSKRVSRILVSLMQAFAEQSAIAPQNARLFKEIAQKAASSRLPI
jgi:hypothetical protein